MINTFIHSRSSLENHTQFQTKMASLYPFSDQNGENTTPFGAVHDCMAYIREYSPRRGGRVRDRSRLSLQLWVSRCALGTPERRIGPVRSCPL